MSRFIEIPGHPVPTGAETKDFTTHDGARLRAAFFPAPQPRGTVVLAPGWAEFIEKYFETVADLQSRGFNVAMMDWRGQGLSDRASPSATKWVGYFETITEDLRFFQEYEVRPRFGGPYILMTHSMGGLPALKLLASGYEGFSRAVLCAPMTQLFPKSQLGFYNGLATVLCGAGLARAHTARSKNADVFDGNIFTHDKARHQMFVDLRAKEPMAANDPVTFGWVNAALKATAAIHEPGALSGIKIPVLIISAGEEQQIDGSDHQIIAEASEKISLVTIPGALHEILMERDDLRALYWKAFDEFVGRPV
ncbi:MAG: alpha/beta hydrolase [Parvularculaceae bacterium]